LFLRSVLNVAGTSSYILNLMGIWHP